VQETGRSYDLWFGSLHSVIRERWLPVCFGFGSNACEH
jgi:hypothetical protein